MFPSRTNLMLVLLAVMLAALLTSCSSQSTANGPHATVSMRDGTQVAGTQDELTKAGATGVTKLPAADSSKVSIY